MVTVQSLGEVELIARVSRRLGRTAAVRVGIGDDAAVLRLPGGAGRPRQLLLASDMLVEGVHFNLPARGQVRHTGRRSVAPRWVGWKALACNLSDIAAMGGRPYAAVVSLGLPRRTPVRVVDELFRGLARCARQFEVAVVGGDTVRAPRLVVDVTILGVARPEHLTLRTGARPGDVLFVTGRLGGSLASGRHARFQPRLREAQWLVRHLPVHAMIDLSDGLASDLWQLARASRVTMRIDAQRVPVSRSARTLAHALCDGEDFELLFTVSRHAAARLPRQIFGCPVTRIGRVVRRGAGVELQQGSVIRRLAPKGFRHL